MELEDVLATPREQLATSREQNAQLRQLIGFQQQNLEAFLLTQNGLVEQIRSQTEQMEQLQQAAQQQREAAQARIAQLEAMVLQLTTKIDALLVRLGEQEPPQKPDKPEPSKKPSASSGKQKPKGDSNWTHPNHNHHNGKSGPPAHLERVDVEVEVEGCCPHCNHDRLHKHSELVSEAIDVVRAHLRVRRITREVRRCGSCRKRVTATMPPMPMQRVSCTFEMLAYLAYMKLVLFVPLDRLNRDFTAQGAPIGAAMLSRWFHECGQLLLAVSAQMRQELLAGDHLRFDATGLTLVDFSETGKRPVISGQVVVFCTPELVLFTTPSKHGEHIEDFLTIGEGEDARPWQGTATADAVNIHDQLFNVEGRTESGCNAHGLRKFRDDVDCAPLLAQEAMGSLTGGTRPSRKRRRRGWSERRCWRLALEDPGRVGGPLPHGLRRRSDAEACLQRGDEAAELGGGPGADPADHLTLRQRREPRAGVTWTMSLTRPAPGRDACAQPIPGARVLHTAEGSTLSGCSTHTSSDPRHSALT